jgi:regulator of cell morphogenesis and NO signaling
MHKGGVIMAINATKKVGELAVEVPRAISLFEGLGIDYCCGGNRSLEEACSLSGVNTEQVIQTLEETLAAITLGESSKDWNVAPLSELTSHIVTKHHGYVRTELARLEPLLEKVCSAHGQNHSELFTIQEFLHGLSQEMAMHMYKEENILFPYIEQMEAAVNGRRPMPFPPFGTVRNPIQMMETEHEGAAEALRGMRKTSGNFSVPTDGCASYQALYKGLIDFEKDLHLHIHLENNVLFPRASAMEAGAPN